MITDQDRNQDITKPTNIKEIENIKKTNKHKDN